MLVEMRDTSTIKPYAGNPRSNDHAVDAVAASIREFGFRQPLVLDKQGVIVVGSTRFKAALKLGMKSVPVHVAKGLTPAQLKAYRICDNKTSEIADWDYGLLVQELADLQKMDFDLDQVGFSPDELSSILETEIEPGLTDPDDVPAPPDQAITKPGDVWLLGNHRLLCADSGNAQDVDRLLAGASIHLVNTDPPYNVKVEPRSNNAIAAGLSSFSGGAPRQKRPFDKTRRANGLKHHQAFDVARQGKKKATTKKLRAKDRPLANDFVAEEAFGRMLHAWFGNLARVLLPGRAFFLWGGYSNIGNYPAALRACGLYFSQAIIWIKEHPVLTRKDFLGNHEWCFYGWREGAAHKFFGPNNATDVWSVKKVNPQSMVHLTEKPVELARRALEHSSKPGENILDLFAGSGSTLIAAEQTSRRAFLMEIDALYCDIIVERWQRFTGKKAIREGAVRTSRRRASWR
jgi:DNA modification methylase